MTRKQRKIAARRALAWNHAHPERVKINHKSYYAKNKKRLMADCVRRARLNPKATKLRAQAFHAKYPWYNMWQQACQRCENPKHPRYHDYGGKGVRFHLSHSDMISMWARDHACEIIAPSLDRINKKGNYTLENCHFIPSSERMLNFRKKKHLAKIQK